MVEKFARFYELKQLKKQIDDEIEELRAEFLGHFQAPIKLDVGDYQLKVTYQEKREYDDNKVYNALPDPSIWRLVSRVDPAKLTSLIKLNIIGEHILSDTYELKKVPYIQVQKR
ncbi:hypothetical protein ACQCN2_06695 [Brevibacillus ginsengisoli]|uniref:hypothetical protein n=1 Tax=Brevibacillus ginsengisoli TaxID=363854 RepID=UPI003CED3C0B